jgi:hypothetical protein
MKRIISVVLSIMMAISLASCANAAAGTQPDLTNGANSATDTQSNSAANGTNSETDSQSGSAATGANSTTEANAGANSAAGADAVADTQSGSAANVTNAATGSTSTTTNAGTETTAEQPKTKAEDLDIAWDSSATRLSFISKIATITKGGTYVVSGNIPDGQIVINNESDELVRLVLNGVNLTNPRGAAIYAKACDKLLIILADGTQNTITDGGANFVYDDMAEEKPNAAIWSKNDLTINGKGSLTVNAGFNNGVGTNDDLLIASGNIVVNAVNHALKGKDTVTVLDGAIKLSTTEGDGIQTDNTEENGNIFINGGTLTFSVADDGIHADNVLEISGGKIVILKAYEGLEGAVINILGGDIDITASDDGVNAAGGSSNGTTAERPMGTRPTGDTVPTDGTASADSTAPQGGGFGGRSGGVPPTDGTLPADGTAPANGTAPQGGGFGGRGGVPPTDGTVPATGTVPQSGGFDSFSAKSSYSLNISGGNITVHAGRDCLDSNGTVNISGGNLYLISDMHTGGDGAIDPDGEISITGGTIVYDGSNTTGRFGANSPQSFIYTATAIKQGDSVTVSKSGKTLLTFTATQSMAALAVSVKGITAGESYDVSINGSVSSVTAGTGGSGMGGMGGGRGMGGRAMGG